MEHRQLNHRSNISSLTGIRGAASLLVLAHHLPISQTFGLKGAIPVITNGNYGVELFFILSGFILTLAHHQDFERLSMRETGRFYLVRALRVYPLHLSILAIIAATVAALPDYAAWVRTIPGFGDAYSLHGFIQTATLTNRVGLPFSGEWNGPSWSLSSEMVGYVVFPVIIVVVARIDKMRTCLFAVSSLLISYVAIRYISDVGVLRMILTFPAGILLGRSFIINGSYNYYASYISLCGALGFLAALSIGNLAPFSVFASAALVYGLAFNKGVISRILNFPVSIYLGRISFSLYLSHHFVFMFITWWMWHGGVPASHQLLCLAAMAGITIAIAHILYHAVEKPSHSFGRRLASWLYYKQKLDVIPAYETSGGVMMHHQGASSTGREETR